MEVSATRSLMSCIDGLWRTGRRRQRSPSMRQGETRAAGLKFLRRLP
jgi:hypothetical protein